MALSDSIAQWVRDRGNEAKAQLSDTRNPLTPWVRMLARESLQAIRNQIIPWNSWLSTPQFGPDFIQQDMGKLFNAPNRGALAIWNVIALGVGAFGIVGHYVDAWFGQRFQEYRAAYRPETISTADAVAAVVQSRIPIEKGLVYAAKNGYLDDDFRLLVESYGDPPGPSQVLELLNRKVIDRDRAVQGLKESRLKNDWIEDVLKLRYAQPTLADLVRFAVREVFDPTLRRELDLDSDYPQQLTAEADKVGADETLARNYWAAHWQLPSPTQAFSMLHRGLITQSELNSLIKAADYAPKWRDKLLAISFNPLTRVDVRRMHQLGVLTDAQLVRAYQDAGYSPENAQRLADFTIKYNSGQLKKVGVHQLDLTRAEILNAYAEFVIPRDEAKTHLVSLGYDESEAETLIATEEHQNLKAQRQAELSFIQAQYEAGSIEEPAAMTALDGLAIPTRQRDALIAKWSMARRRGNAILGLAQVKDLYQGKHWDTDRTMHELGLIGYNYERANALIWLWSDQNA